MKSLLLVAAFLFLASLRVAEAQMYTVTNTNGSGPGSLHYAIGQASAYPGGSTITFNIPGPGVHKIDVGANPLPQVQKVFIDGYSQPGAHPNTLAVGNDAVILIQIDGGGRPGRYGFWVRGSTHLRGLSITGCDTGIGLLDPLGGNVVEGNFIGLDPAGQTGSPNRVGVGSTHGGTIGGNTPATRNVISGNMFGIYLSTIEPLTVAGNYIGTDLRGTAARPNSIGVIVEAGTKPAIVIGGNNPASANVISGNNYGVTLGFPRVSPDGHRFSNGASFVTVSGNLIGPAADGEGRLGNVHQGVAIWDGMNNTIGGPNASSGNTIAFNGGQGVSVEDWAESASGNRIFSNSIYGNGICDLDLKGDGPTLNDPNDADPGPNNLQNYPVITGASTTNGVATISGTLHSSPSTQFTIQFFANSLSFATPGQAYLGSTNVTTDGNGNAMFSASFPISNSNVVFNVTATSAAGDTSEFFFNPGRLKNISTRSQVLAADHAMIGGFILKRLDNATSHVVVRALGPSLAMNGIPAANVLQDPTLGLYDATGSLVATNDNWRDDPNAGRLGSLAPKDDLEAALSPDLAPGAYTVVVRGKNGSSGIGIVEVYLDESSFAPDMANLSTRAVAGNGDDVVIGGIIITDSVGPARCVFRGMGPSLANAGVSNPLPDPTLELHDGNGKVLASNDDWKEHDEAAVRDTGLAPQADAESVILATLPVGAYTAIVRGKGSDTGVALIEVYNLH